jgi:alpha-methylacyl-CoA racemase
VTPVLAVAEALEHPQFVARAMAVQADGVTAVRATGETFRLGLCGRPAAPAPGEHSEEVLREAGFTESEIATLRQHGDHLRPVGAGGRRSAFQSA